MSDDDEPRTSPTRPARKGWMAPTVGADTVAPPPRETVPLTPSLSVFDPPDRRFAEKTELGRGGMGRVVEAFDRALGRSVAIKQSLATASTDLARFEREVRITAQLQHPSVIPILDVGRDPDGQPFYIMRKIEGEPLADRVDAAPTVRDRLALVSPLLGAIDAAAYAHAKGIIHRDIKPWNILLGPFGETLMIDWGIARQLDEAPEAPEMVERDEGTALTRLGVAQGSPGFLAPEQARGEVVDKRADVYSLGATLFFVLAGKIPYGRTDPTDAIARAAAGEPADFTWIPAEVPRELVAITTKAMAIERDERYVDAGELAADLRRFLAGQLVAAHEYTPRERIVRWLRRHRVATTVTALALIAIAVITTVSIRQVLEDRDAAEAARASAVLAEELANKRATEMLIDRARSLVTSDPTSAIASLRDLPPESTQWSDARAITRAAIRGGIDRKIGQHRGSISTLEFSADGTRLLSGSFQLAVHDLPSGKMRTLVDRPVGQATWWGPRTIAAIFHEEQRTYAALVDIETTEVHELDAKRPIKLLALPDRLLVLGEDESLIAYDRTRTATPVIAAGVRAVAARATTIVAVVYDRTPSGELKGPPKLVVVDGATPRTIQIPALGNLRLSPDRQRAAVLDHTGTVREWTLATLEAPPRTWRSSTRGNIEYVGQTLHAWSGDGSGFVSLEAGEPRPLWTARERKLGVLFDHIYPFDGGAVLATDTGQLAVAKEAAVLELAHRPLSMRRVAVESSGKWIALGLGDGGVLLLDLTPVIPQVIPVSPTATLAGSVGNMAMVLDAPDPMIEPQHASKPRGFVFHDLVTGRRVPAAHIPQATHIVAEGNLVAGKDPAQGGHYWVWNAGGELVMELERAIWVRIKAGAVYWLDLDGVVWSRVPQERAIELGRLPPDWAIDQTRPGARVVMFNVRGSEPVVGIQPNLADTQLFRVTKSGPQRIDLGVSGVRHVLGQLGGVWWTQERMSEDLALWRGARRIPLRHRSRSSVLLADRVWAFGDATLTEIDRDGRIVRELIVPDAPPAFTTDTVLMPDAGGVVEISPGSNVRGVLHVGGRALMVSTSADHQRIVALVVAADDSRHLAHWTDPVPSDPAQLRSYLQTLTNARLEPGSNSIRWDD